MLTRWLAFVRGLGSRRRALREVDEELQFHIEMESEANRARGMTRLEAKRAAMRTIGGATQTIEAVQDVRGLWIETFWQDLRATTRRLAREPGFAVIAVLTLTLAVGANTAILSIADAVLFRPLPYADPDRVSILQARDRSTGEPSTLVPYSFISAINAHARDIGEVGFANTGPNVVVLSQDGPVPVQTVSVSANYFSILGVEPARGRMLDMGDANDQGFAVLSHAAWQQRFAGDPEIVGRSVTLGASTFHIVGVLPHDFVFPSQFVGKPEVVTLLTPIAPGGLGGAFHPIVRLAPGTSHERAQAAIETTVGPIAAADPDWRNQTLVLEDVRSVLYGLAPAPIMKFLLASASLVLLIGCAHLAHLLLVRGYRYRDELAVRVALGAGRARVVRPIFLEAMIIGCVTAVICVTTTALFFDALLTQVPAVAYLGAPVGVSWRVAVASLSLSLAATLLFAALPSWRAARLDPSPLLPDRTVGGGRPGSLGRPLVMLQVALSVVAIFGAMIAARAFVSVLNTPLGFSTDRVVRIGVRPPRPGNPPQQVVAVRPGQVEMARGATPPADTSAFYPRILDAIRSHPAVLAAGATTGLPLGGQAPYSAVQRQDSTDRAGVGLDYVLPGFFETVEANIVRGRAPTWDDFRTDPDIAVVSDAAAAVLFPRVEPLGQVFQEFRTNRRFRIIGVVAALRQSVAGQDLPRAYVFPAGGRGIMTPLVRLRSHDDTVLPQLKAAVRGIAPESLVTIQWWDDAISANTAYKNPRFQTLVLGTFGLLALTLTGLGVFGVVNHLVASRRKELGLRLALGAAPRALLAFVMRKAIAPVLLGLAIGVLSTGWLAELAEAQLFRVNTDDPATLVASTMAVVLAALAASYFPARRAARLDPVTTLRGE